MYPRFDSRLLSKKARTGVNLPSILTVADSRHTSPPSPLKVETSRPLIHLKPKEQSRLLYPRSSRNLVNQLVSYLAMFFRPDWSIDDTFLRDIRKNEYSRHSIVL